jgi:hypothetical protein
MTSIGFASAAETTRLASSVTAPPLLNDAAVRAALERAYRLPSFNPPPGPAGLGQNLGRAGGFLAAFLAGRYLTSEGELNLAKDTGQVPGYVQMSDMQQASRAFDGARFDASAARDFSADQRGRLLVGTAELQRLFEDGRITAAERSDGLESLFQGLKAGAPTGSGQSQPAVYGPTLQELERGAQQQRRDNNSQQWPVVSPPTQVVPVTPGLPSRIGGISAERVPYSEPALQQAISDARTFNATSPTQVALGYAVQDRASGQWHVERIAGITPTEARTLVYNLNQRQQLAHPTEQVFQSSGIGGWPDAQGRPAGAERDLQLRESNAYFSSLTPEQVTAAAQAGALTVNGKTGAVFSLDSAADLQRRIVGGGGPPGANAAERGHVSLAIQRSYTIPGPNGAERTVHGIELFADLSPAEARSVLNAAARDRSLLAPAGAGDAIDWNLARNGLSRQGLDQRDRQLSQPGTATPSAPAGNEPRPIRPEELPSLPEPQILPGGDDVQRVSREYGVAETDVRAVMQANPGMSAEQAAQYLKGSLLAAPTGTTMAQVPPSPPRNTPARPLAGDAGAAPEPGTGQTISLLQPGDLGMPTTTGADGASVITYGFTGPTADLDKAKWEASGYQLRDSKEPDGRWGVYVTDANGQVVGFIANARLANSADRLWQTIQHNAQQMADPTKREAYVGKWRAAINAVLDPTANRRPPSDIANQVRRLSELEQAERVRQDRQGAGEEIILPRDHPGLPENRTPPGLQQRPTP